MSLITPSIRKRSMSGPTPASTPKNGFALMSTSVHPSRAGSNPEEAALRFPQMQESTQRCQSCLDEIKGKFNYKRLKDRLSKNKSIYQKSGKPVYQKHMVQV